MKKLILIVCLVAFLSGSAWAQVDVIPDLRQEISMGYGFRPASGFQWRSPWYYYQTIDKVGAIYGTYTYRINGEIGIGLTYCYDPRRLGYFTDKTLETPVCDLDESSHTVMLHVKSNWLDKKWFSLYSKAGVGMAFWQYKLIQYHSDMYEIRLPEQNSCFAYQLVPIGIEVGSEQFAGFFQVGIGMEGCLSAGLRFRF
jgi:hypothetical protein